MKTTDKPLMSTKELGLTPTSSGKVRDIFDLGGTLAIVATDRISAYDVVMPNGIPNKGRVLTQLSLFWLGLLNVPNHLISARICDLPPSMRRITPLDGRVMLCRKAEVVPVECVVRGYITGSGWKSYRDDGTVCGIRLPAGLKQCQELPNAIFTPATKATTGHDENITFEQMCEVIKQWLASHEEIIWGSPEPLETHALDLAENLMERSVSAYRRAHDYAFSRGIIIADTKFEWGLLPNGQIILVDEVLTPDSSRFWPTDGYEPGHDQPSFDKQFLRNWLDGIGFNRKPPGPELPPDVVEKTAEKYLEAHRLLTGKQLVA